MSSLADSYEDRFRMVGAVVLLCVAVLATMTAVWCLLLGLGERPASPMVFWPASLVTVAGVCSAWVWGIVWPAWISVVALVLVLRGLHLMRRLRNRPRLNNGR